MHKQENYFLSLERNQKFELKDDFELLDIMLDDSKGQPPLYHPGPYWAYKAKNMANEIRRCGISNFRGSNNHIGLGIADNPYLDVRHSYNYGIRKAARWLTQAYPLNLMFQAQVNWTESYAKENMTYIQEILDLKTRTKDLLRKYRVPYSLLGGCLTKTKIGQTEYSIHYLTLLERLDNIAAHINFSNATSVFEIGGGFGVNIHLLLENYSGIRKVLYLDVPPSLYVGTQYLKAFYGSSVYDYRELRNEDFIQFSKNNSLEILCIAPWQIEKYISPVDVFMNSNSFVEMPENVVKNYVDKFKGFPESINSAIALTTYDCFDLNTTFHPNKLPKFFEDRKFNYFETDTLLNSDRKNLYFVSPGKLSFQ